MVREQQVVLAIMLSLNMMSMVLSFIAYMLIMVPSWLRQVTLLVEATKLLQWATLELKQSIYILKYGSKTILTGMQIIRFRHKCTGQQR